MKIREYRGPLTVLASGVLGFSLFCIVSAAAISGPNVSTTPINIQPQDMVDSAISNINTLAALTMESVAQYIPTSTLSPTITSTHTDLPTNTATLPPTRTRVPPTRTRGPFDPPPPAPTNTHQPAPTNTPNPSPTDTPLPSPTDIDTDTPVPPPPTATDPPPTAIDTPVPPPTNTSEPDPTNPPVPTGTNDAAVDTNPTPTP